MKTVKIDGGFFIGAVICLGSCIFTCNFVLLGTPVPTAESSLWEILMYFAKLVSGISITAAQIFGLKNYKQTGDRFMFNLFRAATTVSIFMSVCAFHSMLETGAVNVGRLSSVDSVIESQKEHIIQSLENLRRQRSRFVVFAKSTDGIDQQIKKYERKLESITNQILTDRIEIL